METLIFAAACGVFIGIFSGLLGIGGGTVMVPLFRIVFGLPAIGATATSLFAIIPTSISGCVTHLKNKTCIPLLGLIAGLSGAVTSALGVFAASNSPSWLIMLAAACIVAYSSYTMFKKALNCPKEESEVKGSAKASIKTNAEAKTNVEVKAKTEAKFETEPEITAATNANAAETSANNAAAKETDAVAKVASEAVGYQPFTFTPKKVVIAIIIGLIAGFASGYVGVGGGFIMVPMFVGVLGVMMRQASGTSLIAICILALPGVIEQGILGNIDYLIGIATVCGSIPGAVIGANLIKKVPERKLRFIFSGFLLVASAMLIFKEFVPMLAG